MENLLSGPFENEIVVADPDKYKNKKGRFCPELLARG